MGCCWECGHPIAGNGPSTCETCSAIAEERADDERYERERAKAETITGSLSITEYNRIEMADTCPVTGLDIPECSCPICTRELIATSGWRRSDNDEPLSDPCPNQSRDYEHGPALPDHPCPFQQEINENDTPCNCCDACTSECARDI